MVATSLVPRLSCVGRGKEPGTHCLHMLSSPKISGNLEISVKSAPLHSLLSYKSCLSLTTLCVDDDEGAVEVLSPSLAGIVHMFTHSS